MVRRVFCLTFVCRYQVTYAGESICIQRGIVWEI